MATPMAPDLTQLPLAVVIAHSADCGHCREYLPIVREVAPAYAGRIPTVLIDIAHFPAMIDALAVQATPTTVVLRYGQLQDSRVGILDASDLHGLYRGLT